MRSFIRLMIGCCLVALALCARPADVSPAETYDPSDVAVIDRILRVNDAQNGVLAAHGWEAGKPETWLAFAEAKPNRMASLAWKDGRLERLELDGAGLVGTLELSGLSGLKNLNVSHNNLPEIKGLGGLTGLETLRAAGSGVHSLGDLSGLTRLRTLDLSTNQLEDIGDLSRLTGLETLNVSYNRLTHLGNLGRLTGLRSLNVDFNQLEDIGDLGGLSDLEILNASYNQLTRVGDLRLLTRLRWLNISGNRLTTIQGLRALSKLEFLNVSSNDLKDLGPLTCYATLTALRVSGNKLTRMPDLTRMTSLRWLDVGGNPCTKPEFLDSLREGMLEELGYSDDQFPTLRLADKPLQKIKNLTIFVSSPGFSVDLDGRPLEKIDLLGPFLPERSILAERFANPGPLGKLEIALGQYSLTEVRHLFEKFRPEELNGFVNAPPFLECQGFEPKPLQPGIAYTPTDISPCLAADYEAAGPGVTLGAKVRAASSEDVRQTLPIEKEGPPSYIFQDGRLTFTQAGDYTLTLECQDFQGAEGAVYVFYDDVLRVRNQ